MDEYKILKRRHFTFFGRMWTLLFTDKVPPLGPDDDTVYAGRCDSDNSIIMVRLYDGNGSRLAKGEIRRTILHELIHLILMDGKHFDANQNEPMVEWLVKGLIQLGLVDMEEGFMDEDWGAGTPDTNIPTLG